MENKKGNLYLRKRLEDNNGKWMGFKIGENNKLIVRIRRNARKHFYVTVDKYLGENKIMVHDAFGSEKGIAIRFNKHCFSLEPQLDKKQGRTGGRAELCPTS